MEALSRAVESLAATPAGTELPAGARQTVDTLLDALEAGWIRADWRTTENKRRARYYEITAAGHQELHTEESRWTAISAAIGQVLKEA